MKFGTKLDVDSALRLRIRPLYNGTYLATVVENGSGNMSAPSLDSFLSGQKPGSRYDDSGAMYYVVAVVLIYGLSIIFMIGSLIRKDEKDRSVYTYMKDIDRVRQLQKRQEKFRTRLMIQKKRVKHILGTNTAIVLEKLSIRPNSSDPETTEPERTRRATPPARDLPLREEGTFWDVRSPSVFSSPRGCSPRQHSSDSLFFPPGFAERQDSRISMWSSDSAPDLESEESACPLLQPAFRSPGSPYCGLDRYSGEVASARSESCFVDMSINSGEADVRFVVGGANEQDDAEDDVMGSIVPPLDPVPEVDEDDGHV